jgi:glutathione S-transferase
MFQPHPAGLAGSQWTPEMKLRYSQSSPYARKVLVVAHERGLAECIDLMPASTSPVELNQDVARENPLAKIPSLTLDDGHALYDSRVIAEYLDSVGGAMLFPPVGPMRWTALRQQALADGLLDAAILIRYERVLRPAEKQWPEWIEGQFVKLRAALDTFEHETKNLDSALTIGPIAVACALGYIDFRFANENWRRTRPQLAAFYDKFSQRPSMVASVPPAS